MTATQILIPSPDAVDPAVLAAQRQLNEMLASLPNPDLTTAAGLIELRHNTSPPQGEIASARSEITITGPGGDDLRLHVITPDGPVQAVMLRIHGGGLVAGAPEDDDTFNDQLARACGLVIVSPEYRLVPEATMGDGTEDCVAAIRWLAAHADDEFGTTRLLLGGNSAGASHAAQTLLRLRDGDEPAFAMVEAVLLDCGIYDMSGTPSARAADETTVILTHEFLFGLFDLGLPDLEPEDRRIATASALYADLTGLPPALFLVGALDPLADDSRFMASRWQAAGGHADLDVWPEGAHAFANMNTPLGALALQRIAAWLNYRLSGDAAAAAAPATTSADPVVVVRRYLDEVVNAGKLDALPQLWATDGQWHGGSMGDLDGLDAVTSFAAGDGASAFSDMHLTIDDIITHGDKVVVRFTNSGTQVGPFMGAPATGKHAAWLGIGVYTVTNGRIAEAWFGEDILSMLLQLGVITLPA